MRLSPGQDHFARRKRPRTLQLVRRQHHRATLRRGTPHEAVERSSPLGIEPSVGLVEEQQPWRPNQRDPDRKSAALTGRESTVQNPLQRPKPDLPDDRVDRFRAGIHRPRREPQVLQHGQIVVTRRLVPDESHEPPMGSPIDGEVEPEDLTDTRVHRHEPGQQPEQRRLPGTVPAGEEDNLAGMDIKIDTGQGREPTEETHGRTETDDGLHSASGKEVPSVYGRDSATVEPRPATVQRPTTTPLIGSAVVRRSAAALGRALITVGVLILLFAAYQLWGTGIYTAQQQDRLRQQFTSELHKSSPSPPPTTIPSPTTTTTTSPPSPPLPPSGDAVAQIRIPKIGVDDIVVNGVSLDDLRKGPGHYPETPLPGQLGNAAIAGHRTTYGAPFGNLDQLSAGDEILLRTVQGSFTYRVYSQLVVDPSDVAVLNADPNHPATITLTTCNPKYSASQRLIVQASLENATPLPPPPGLGTKAKIASASLSGDSGSLAPAVTTGLIALLIGTLWWLAYHRHPRWTAWLAGAIPFLVALFFFYSYLERVLPANY